MTSVTFAEGSQLTSIGNFAFIDCYELTSVNYQGTKAKWNAISKSSDWNSNTGDYVIHCTDGDISE